MIIEPFSVMINSVVIADLKARLASTRWPPLEQGGGVNRAALKAMCDRWQAQDWPATQAELNVHPHFSADIDGAMVHFVHARSAREDAVPLLLLNGWPSTFAELLPLIEPLRAPSGDEQAFHVVIPSLPGYGFSHARPDGFDPVKIAGAMAQLMSALGYEKFGVHGSDIGAGVALGLALKHAHRVIGLHSVNVYWAYPPPDDLSEVEKKYLGSAQGWFMTDGGYAHIQGTRPRTLDVALNDSPAGLAAWVLEKFADWSDGGLDAFDPNALTTTLTIYWATQCIGASFAPYEAQMGASPDIAQRIETPTGVIVFPKDISPAPRAWGDRWLNVKRWTEAPRGGHFPALEAPDILVEDLRAFFAEVRA